ncbi:leucine-rich repeat-containing protein 51 isoform X2 [Microcebus murinus]|uniref:leucine-rich repeat-containing protein 51 isoform X2 n=1 Tax=Microcebus murinus TaxID=30608 RepID=UPI003F6DA4D1
MSRRDYMNTLVQEPPLDYSFRSIHIIPVPTHMRVHMHMHTTFVHVLTIVPVLLYLVNISEATEIQASASLDLVSEDPRPGLRPLRHSKSGKSLTQSLWLNNNVLNDLEHFNEVVSQLLAYPQNLAWIDLSFNDLTSIDPVLTTFCNLSVIYLHGNSIHRLSEVNKLAVLPRLRSLTLHGNPMEEEKGYSGITKADRTTAEVWKRMNIKPKKVKIKQNAL